MKKWEKLLKIKKGKNLHKCLEGGNEEDNSEG